MINFCRYHSPIPRLRTSASGPGARMTTTSGQWDWDSDRRGPRTGPWVAQHLHHKRTRIDARACLRCASGASGGCRRGNASIEGGKGRRCGRRRGPILSIAGFQVAVAPSSRTVTGGRGVLAPPLWGCVARAAPRVHCAPPYVPGYGLGRGVFLYWGERTGGAKV